MRRSGILCHISSLPSSYGIGTFGQSAYDFVDFLVTSKQSFWQILPLGPTSYGDSPYQTFSAFALNPYFIDLEMLVLEKLIEKKDIISTFENPRFIEYHHLYLERYEILNKAFNNFKPTKAYEDFLEKHKHWLFDYSLFMALKLFYQGQSWLNWDEKIRNREESTLKHYSEVLKKDIDFYQFLQFKAYQQWLNLKSYANKHQVQIIGDMPIYVSYDSSDVWANPEMFDLDENKKPNHVAGVPPDYFAKDGQLWGNPLYNWDHLEKNNFTWWIDRIASDTLLFDHIRIDHFIGFVNYFSITYGEKTARQGVWKKGPGKKLFDVIKAKLGDVHIIAEDLGVLNEHVRDLIKQTGFPGMKVLQFAFDAKEESDYLPHLYTENVVVYTGTHDNQTTSSWFKTLAKEDLRYCYDYINYQGVGSPVDSLIKLALASIAQTAVIPIQDYLHLTDEARMNTPSTQSNNWRWRLLETDLTKDLSQKIKKLSQLYGRVTSANQ